MIDRATVQKITDTADIVEVVSDYVHLTRRGANYMGLCPFHNERTPSFSVNKQRNFCYCFSCHKGGSPVNFIMEKEGLSYHDALLHLAKRYGIKVEERELTDEERARQTRRESMLVANEWASAEMSRNLWETEEGRNVGLSYFYGRGVTEQAIRKFHLGYSIDKGNSLCESASKAGIDLDVMREIGLLGKSQDGRLYDRFRGRVMFPIMNPAGKVIAFGGRDLKGGPAKYINSPESELYKKSNELYGIFQAKSAIVRQNKCFLVEGYLDVIGMWQSGMENVVASSGTALTDGQIALIHRFTENITILYDGDKAGIKAALRGIDMLLSHKMSVKVLLLPDGHDPDSFARSTTPEKFREYVEEHETDIIRFKAKVLLDEAGNDPQRRASAATSVARSIAHISDEVQRTVYIQECSRIMNINEQVIARAVRDAGFALQQQWKQERERRNLEKSGYTQTPQPPTVHEVSSTDAAGGDRNASANPQGGVIPQSAVTSASASTTERVSVKDLLSDMLLRVQREVLECCVRYGLCEFCNCMDEDGNLFKISVAEYVDLELQEDDFDFNSEIYRKVFGMILGMKEDMEKARALRMEDVEKEIEALRKERIEEIGNLDLTMSEIEMKEKRLEEELDGMRKKAWNEFTRDFTGRMLASDPDDEVRKIATELLLEPYQLSKIYKQDKNSDEKLADEVGRLVERHIQEWRHEYVNIAMARIVSRISEIEGTPGSENEIMDLQRQAKKVSGMRKSLTKTIGDRVLSGRKNWK